MKLAARSILMLKNIALNITIPYLLIASLKIYLKIPELWADKMKNAEDLTLPSGLKPNPSISCTGLHHGAPGFRGGISNVLQ